MRPVAVVAAVSVVAELIAYDDVLPALGAAAFGTAVAALLVHLVLPRVDPAAHGILAISFGLSALFTTIAFWSALPFAFAVAAARAGRAGAVLGGIATVIALVFCILA